MHTLVMPFIQAVIYYFTIPFEAEELLSPTQFHVLLHVSSSTTAQKPDTLFVCVWTHTKALSYETHPFETH